MSGWIKLQREIQDHWVYSFKDPKKTLAWIDLLLLANHSDKQFLIKNRLVKCERGQVALSQVSLQKRWDMSQNAVKRLLRLFENDGMIELKTNELTSIITICNYSSYQESERADERPHGRAVERATDEHSNDKQECKNEKNVRMKEEKNINTTPQDISEFNKQTTSKVISKKTSVEILKNYDLPETLVNDFVMLRKSKKAPITETALKGLAKEAEKAGISLEEAITICIERNWQTFKADWIKENINERTKDTKQSRHASIINAIYSTEH